jgi:hypothetical protein
MWHDFLVWLVRGLAVGLGYTAGCIIAARVLGFVGKKA